MTAAPPPTVGDLYSPEQPVAAIVRETARSGWRHPFTTPELVQLGRVMARVVFPRSPYRTGSCDQLPPARDVYCTATRPSLGNPAHALTVRIRMTGCPVGSDDEALDGRECNLWEDGSARGVIVAVLPPAQTKWRHQR